MKKLFYIIVFLVPAMAFAQIKISELPTLSGPADNVLVPVVSNGVTKKVNGSQLKTTILWDSVKNKPALITQSQLDDSTNAIRSSGSNTVSVDGSTITGDGSTGNPLVSHLTGSVPSTRSITINSVSHDLSSDITYNVGTLIGSDTTNKWVTTLYNRNDSVFILKNGALTFIYKDKIGSFDTTTIYNILSGKQNVLGFTPENTSNKATSLATLNNTLYPTTQAVSNYITAQGFQTANQSITITATGDATGTSSSSGTSPSLPLTVSKINGTSLAGLGTGILKNTTGTGIPSIAVAADFPTLNQNTTGNASTVTTNANLTGPVTSSGNATTITPVITSGSCINCNLTYNAAGQVTVAANGSGGSTSLYAKRGIIKNADSASLSVDSNLVPIQNDVFNMPQIKKYSAAQGVGASNNVTNYQYYTVDSLPYNYSVTDSLGLEHGGWLAASTSGDSVAVSAPYGVAIGHSIIAGHPGYNSGLENVNYTQYDSLGTIEYRLGQLTGYTCRNMGIGGQTSTQIRNRFLRDALGLISDPADGRGSKILSHKPEYILIDAWVNDPFNSVSLATTQQNAIWMASMCFEYGIPCIMLTSEGQGGNQLSRAQATQIRQFNIWLLSGALNGYGVTVVNTNSFWCSGVYSPYLGYYSDTKPSSFVNTTDLIHFTKTGYDSLGYIIFRTAKLPVLDSMIFYCQNSSTNPITNLNRPTSVTINTITYSLPNVARSAIAMTSPIKDSMYIKILASTNLTGSSTQTGFNHIEYHFTNNPTNQPWYTQKQVTQGAQTADLYANTVNVQPPTANATNYPLTIFSNIGVGGTAMQAITTNGGNTIYFNNTTNATYLFGAAVSIYKSGGTCLGLNGNIMSSSYAVLGSQMKIGDFSSASAYGYGINMVGGGFWVQVGSSSTIGGNSLLKLTESQSATPIITSSNVRTHFFDSNTGLGNVTGYQDTVCNYAITGANKDTVTNNGPTVIIGYEDTTNTPAIGSSQHHSFNNWYGYNRLNQYGGATSIGTNSPSPAAALDITNTTRGFLPPRMTSTQRDSIGYIYIVSFSSTGTWTTPPFPVVSGGVGKGLRIGTYLKNSSAITPFIADAGTQYKVGSSVPTVTFVGGAGTGSPTLTATLGIKGPDNGMIAYITDLGRLQMFNGTSWVNIDNDNNPVIVKNNFLSSQTSTQTVSTYTTGSADSTYQINAYANVTAVSGGNIALTVAYTNESNSASTATFFIPGSTGSTITTIGSVAFAPCFIRAKASTAITVTATVSGTITYNTSASITKYSN